MIQMTSREEHLNYLKLMQEGYAIYQPEIRLAIDYAVDVISGAVKRKCIKVISGNTFRIDNPINGLKVIKLHGVAKGGKDQMERLRKLIEGEEVDIYPNVAMLGRR